MITGTIDLMSNLARPDTFPDPFRDYKTIKSPSDTLFPAITSPSVVGVMSDRIGMERAPDVDEGFGVGVSVGVGAVRLRVCVGVGVGGNEGWVEKFVMRVTFDGGVTGRFVPFLACLSEVFSLSESAQKREGSKT